MKKGLRRVTARRRRRESVEGGVRRRDKIHGVQSKLSKEVKIE